MNWYCNVFLFKAAEFGIKNVIERLVIEKLEMFLINTYRQVFAAKNKVASFF